MPRCPQAPCAPGSPALPAPALHCPLLQGAPAPSGRGARVCRRQALGTGTLIPARAAWVPGPWVGRARRSWAHSLRARLRSAGGAAAVGLCQACMPRGPPPRVSVSTPLLPNAPSPSEALGTQYFYRFSQSRDTLKVILEY